MELCLFELQIIYDKVPHKINLSALATDSPGKLDVFRHDGDTLGVDGAQVGVFKQAHQVCLTGLLQHKEHYDQWWVGSK